MNQEIRPSSLVKFESTEARVEAVNAMHAEFAVERKGILENAMYTACLRYREIGQLLRQINEDCKHGDWLAKFNGSNVSSTSRFAFSYRTGRRYMEIAALFPTEPTLGEFADQKEAIQLVWGNVAELEDIDSREEAPSRGKRNIVEWYTRAHNGLGQIAALFQKKDNEKPIEMWGVPEVQQALEGLEKVERYKDRLQTRFAELVQ